MKKTKILLFVAVIIIFLLLGVSSVQAQFRFDLGITSHLGGAFGTFNNSFFDYYIGIFPPVPIAELSLHYIFINNHYIQQGIGLKLFSLYLINLLYPNYFIEFNFNKFSIGLNIGGGAAFFFVTIIPAIVIRTDFSYRCNERFRIGIGIFTIHTYFFFEDLSDLYIGGLGFHIYVNWVFFTG